MHMDKKRLEEVKEAAEEGDPLAPAVYLPPAIRGKEAQAVVNHVSEPVSVRDNIVRITADGDPVGQLIALMNGMMVPSYAVSDKGELITTYETATMAQRISIAKWLGDRVMPKVNVSMKSEMTDDWEANLRNAAAQTD